MKTSFLLEQFVKFCDKNSVGFPSKSNDYFYSIFKTQKAINLAKEINDYLYFYCEYKDEVQDSHERNNEVRTNCIGYISSRGKYKFASISEGTHCFILHLGSVLHTMRAENMQKEIDHLLKYPYTERVTAGEVYIRLELVDSLEQIKPFIDEAYYLRLKK